VPNRQSVRVLDSERLSNEMAKLSHDLHSNLVGQNRAIDSIIRSLSRSFAGISQPNRPLGSFLLLGPTGSGKTHSVEVLAESLYGPGGFNRVIRVDCAEFQREHEIAKLIGSPPGYVGHDSTSPIITQDKLNSCQTETVFISVLLFDEIEKADDALFDLLLGILDKARMMTGDNQPVNFSKTVIFLTSNLGAEKMKTKIGFLGNREPDKTQESVILTAKKYFRPEFINRLDDIIVFRYLGEFELRKILDLELKAFENRLRDQLTPLDKVFFISFSRETKEYLLRKGINNEFGARELRRVIEREVADPIARLLTSWQIARADKIRVDFSRGGLVFINMGSSLTRAMAISS